MAKQKSIIPIEGTIGGMNFYYLNGKPVARAAGGGFNGAHIKTKANMQRVRDNGSEFGHCSQVNKAFRQALRPFYTSHTFTFFHSRLMTLFTGLKTLDTSSVLGQRRVGLGVNTDAGVRLLETFVYTPDSTLTTALRSSFGMDWSTFTLSLPNLKRSQVPFISGATHMVIQFGVLDFNFETLDADLYMAEPVVLTPSFGRIDLQMTPVLLPSSKGTLMAVYGIRYYREADGVMQELDSKAAVGLAVIAVTTT